jgi:hypothetical protein
VKNLSLVMAEVERMANDPLPVALRPPRIAALERALDEFAPDRGGPGRRRDNGRSASTPLVLSAARGRAGR